MEKMGKYDKYEIENCMDTLIRAEEIKQDPEKMKQVSKLMGKKKKAISSIDDLRAAAQEVEDDE